MAAGDKIGAILGVFWLLCTLASAAVVFSNPLYMEMMLHAVPKCCFIWS